MVEMVVVLSVILLFVGVVAVPRGMAWRRSASLQQAAAGLSGLFARGRRHSLSTRLPYRVAYVPSAGGAAVFEGYRAELTRDRASSRWTLDRRIPLHRGVRVTRPAGPASWVLDAGAVWREGERDSSRDFEHEVLLEAGPPEARLTRRLRMVSGEAPPAGPRLRPRAEEAP